jgi:hypothetical protein
MIYKQTELEKLKLMQSHFLSIEADNQVEDLKVTYNQIVMGINKAITYHKREEEAKKKLAE